jgi:hypothetical protein
MFKRLFKGNNCRFLHVWQNMAVYVQGDIDTSVAQPFTNNFWVNTLYRHNSCMSAAQVVEPYLRKP